MTLSVTVEFSDEELEYFHSLMQRVRDRNGHRTAQEICAAAAAEVDQLRTTTKSPFVTRRIDRVGRLIAMLEDPQWSLPEPERRRVLDGLAYVADAQDLVPDNVPVFGLIDDAVMLELVLRELQHELEGYEEFDAYRRDDAPNRDKPGTHRPVSREDWLESKRAALHARIRERRERELARGGGGFQLITRF